MRNEIHTLLGAYYRCLNGSTSVSVFQGSVPIDHRTDYILLRAESDSDVSNKTYFAANPIVVVEIVTFHDAQIDTSLVESIDDQVKRLLFPTRRTTGLGSFDDMQVVNVRYLDSFYDESFDGQKYVHRKICRFNNRINYEQLNNS